MLGICYGAQLMAQQLGGDVAHTGAGEYGRTALTPHGPLGPDGRVARDGDRAG